MKIEYLNSIPEFIGYLNLMIFNMRLYVLVCSCIYLAKKKNQICNLIVS